MAARVAEAGLKFTTNPKISATAGPTSLTARESGAHRALPADGMNGPRETANFVTN